MNFLEILQPPNKMHKNWFNNIPVMAFRLNNIPVMAFILDKNLPNTSFNVV